MSESVSDSVSAASVSPERAPQVNPLAAAFAASMAESTPRSASPVAATRSAAVAKTGQLTGSLAAAQARFTNDAAAPASLPGFSTATAASHDKSAQPGAAAKPDAPASATDGAATPTTTRAAASARAAQESDATTAKVAAHSSAVPPLPPPPETLAAAKPFTVDAGTLGGHLTSQSLSLSPGAHLPALFEAAPMPTPAGAFWAQAAEDPSLHGALMNDAARVSLDAGAAGEITLHLRIKDGVADVRFEGTATQALEIRPQELRIALASEGLSLGGFESGQSAPRDGQLESDRRDSTPPPAPVSDPSRAIPVSANRAPASAVTLGGRLHVTA
ncbi:MAG: flagellar hook-length control protein FliK [Myxococcales bacterium]|nr:flagellar hook-length control protein FliK [Myxococcales bacterium]